MEMKTTHRGFALVEFTDYYGAKCSLQKSSIVDPQCIWLGIDDPDPKILIPNTGGWKPYKIPVPPNADLNLITRMHLNREQVKALLPALQHFVDTGELPLGDE